jgi:D-alanine-D-alanine ligase
MDRPSEQCQSYRPAILVLCGGGGTEHDISLISAGYVARLIAANGWDIVCAGKGRDGLWRHIPMQDASAPSPLALLEDHRCPPIALRRTLQGVELDVLPHKDCVPTRPIPLRAAFPVMHGTGGEDGAVQGWLDSLGLPYVGSGILASALGFDKVLTKKIWQSLGLPVTPYVFYEAHKILSNAQDTLPRYEDLSTKWNSPFLFVKPSAQGSSVGVHRVDDAKSYQQALRAAAEFGGSVLVEKAIFGREVECAILDGLEGPKASGIGEILIHRGDFYNYTAKYEDPDAAEIIVQADLDQDLCRQLGAMAIQAFTALGCRDLARVDFLIDHKGQIYLNEINTMPGFTPISLYPKLWQAAGLAPEALIDQMMARAVRA